MVNEMSEEKTEVAVKENTEAVEERTPKYSKQELQEANLDNQQNLPDLSKAKRHFVPLSIEYWTPEAEGEEKTVYIHSIGMHMVPDMDTGEERNLECVMLLESNGKTVKRYITAGRILLANIKDAITRGEIIPGTSLTPVSITYVGKKQNRTNARISNAWQIMPLITK